jgi:NTE family protein
MPEAMAANLDPRDRPRIGLVLGAGGIRGCAHAGVIAVLRQAEVSIDLVVGASVGRSSAWPWRLDYRPSI